LFVIVGEESYENEESIIEGEELRKNITVSDYENLEVEIT